MKLSFDLCLLYAMLFFYELGEKMVHTGNVAYKNACVMETCLHYFIARKVPMDF